MLPPAARARASCALAIALATACSSTNSSPPAAPDAAAPRDAAAIDHPVAIDIPPAIDHPVAIDLPPTVDVPDVPARDEGSPTACDWTIGAPVDPVLSVATSPRIGDAVPYRDGAVALVFCTGADGTTEDVDLLFVDRDGHRVGTAVRLESRPLSLVVGSLAVAASGDVAALCGGARATLHHWSAAGRPLRHVDLSVADSQAHAVQTSAAGWSFLRIFDVAPRVHQIELDLDGAVRSDTLLPIPLPTMVRTPFGTPQELHHVHRSTSSDGRRFIVMNEFLGQAISFPPASRYTVVITREGSTAPPVLGSFEGHGRDAFVLVPRPAGALLAVTATSYYRHPLGGSFNTTSFSTRLLDDRATANALTEPWSVSSIATTSPTAVTDTVRGVIALLPLEAPGGSGLERFEMFEVAADGTPGRRRAIPRPAGVTTSSSLVAVRVAGGALALAGVGSPARVIAIPLRCE